MTTTCATNSPQTTSLPPFLVTVSFPVTARSEATRQSMDCFVPRNDGTKLPRNDETKLPRNDETKLPRDHALVRHHLFH